MARAGGSVFELAAAGLPAILVPYPHATADHQTANARFMEQAGAAVVIPDAELDGPRLAREVAALLGSPAADGGDGEGGPRGGAARTRRTGSRTSCWRSWRTTSIEGSPARCVRSSESRIDPRPRTHVRRLWSLPVMAMADPLNAPFAGRALHFMGIGGAGMSGLALVAQQLGATVTGSDQAESSYCERLRAAGIEPVIGHDAANLPEGAEVVVSTAIPEDNPELAAAREAGATVLHRGDLLGELSRMKRTIAVGGTHGKTTTASMAALALLEAGRDPAFLIGGELRAAGTNAAWGAGEWAVIEADESDRSFLKLAPRRGGGHEHRAGPPRHLREPGRAGGGLRGVRGAGGRAGCWGRAWSSAGEGEAVRVRHRGRRTAR